MYGYEIPVNENAYAARERYLNDKKRAEDAMKIKKEYSEFIANSRDYFLSEAMNMILQESLNKDTSSENREYGKALIEGFVRQNTSLKLLNEFEKKTFLLASMADVIKEAHQKVIHSCKEGDTKTFKISKTVNDDFFTKLIGLSDEKISQKINQRVCDSLENYVQANVNDKENLEELAEKTAEKIKNVKARNADEKDKIVKEFTNQYNKQVYDIKQRANRKVGLFEQLLHSTTRSIVSDQNILESFTEESGKLNMSKITDKVTVMYTFLEMLNTTNPNILSSMES